MHILFQLAYELRYYCLYPYLKLLTANVNNTLSTDRITTLHLKTGTRNKTGSEEVQS